MLRPKRTEPLPGQESVWDYPRPPRLEKVSARLRVIFSGQTIADTRSGLSCTRDQPPAGLLHSARGYRAAIFATRRLAVPGASSRAKRNIGRSMLTASRLRTRPGATLRPRPHSQRSRDIWRSMPHASTNAGSMTNASSPSKGISTAAGSPRGLSGLSRVAPGRADGRPWRSRFPGVGAGGRQRRTTRSLYRLRHLTI